MNATISPAALVLDITDVPARMSDGWKAWI